MNWNIIIRGFVSDLRPSALLKCDQVGSASNASFLSGVGSFASGLINTVGQIFGNASAQDFTREMWNANNEYNSPKNQRKRLEEAGYNPYLLTMDSSASGQSVMPSNPPNHPLPGFQNPFHGSMELLQNGLQVESNIELQHAEAQQKIYDTIIKAYQEGGKEFGEQTMEELAPTLERLDFGNSPLARKFEATLQHQLLQNDLAELDKSFKGLENRWYGVIKNDEHRLNQDMHKQYVETLVKIKAEVKNINAMSDKTLAEKEKILAEKVGVLIENGIKGLDFQNAKELQEVIQETAYENLWKLEDDRNYTPFDKNYQYQGKAGQYFPLPSGEFEAAAQLKRNQGRNKFKENRRFKSARKK